MHRRFAAGVVAAASVLVGATGTTSTASPALAVHRPIVGFGANHSTNWSGYDQGLLEKGETFHEISATWVVPTATQHVPGQAAHSATWVGIGGGCIDSGCLLTDPTLIQAGTEQDVDAQGHASYFTWWEIIPLPSFTAPVAVAPGQKVHVEVAETFLPELWQIGIQNLSTGQQWSMLVPYVSTYATAEFVLETPVVLGTSGVGVASLPNLSPVVFDSGTINHAPANLTPGEALQLVDGNGNVLATPSAPDSDADGFADCSYATSCPTPAS